MVTIFKSHSSLYFSSFDLLHSLYCRPPRFSFFTVIDHRASPSSGVIDHRDTPPSPPLTKGYGQVIHMNIQESDRKRTAKELEINRSLECPYVVACYQCFYQNNAFYLILEYMDGGFLLDFLRKVRTIPEDHLTAICKQVVKGLHYLHHQKHVIHRDLKPSNLVINHLGEVKITDFVVSAIVASTSAQANTNVGTYYYMGPERFSEETYGARSDIWSLGMVMLECATGKFPNAISDDGWAATYFSVMQTIIEQPPPRASPDQFSCFK
ncbi:mitogen-activated protein kinase kinase SIPKK-like [Silene latifolia]|uniref:mitogen-activated protein kinase kinase SIPKK-like n=1 Tax=Silene latifolia TaxID=37657 RepID=UPI003D77BDF9